METTNGGPGLGSGPSWNGAGLRHAILEILFDERLKRPKTGARSVKMLADTLDIEEASIEDALEDLQIAELAEKGERLYQVTARGVEFLLDHSLDYAPNVVPITEAKSMGFFSFCPVCSAPFAQGQEKKHQHGRMPRLEFKEFWLDILEFMWEHPAENGVQTGPNAHALMVRFDIPASDLFRALSSRSGFFARKAICAWERGNFSLQMQASPISSNSGRFARVSSYDPN